MTKFNKLDTNVTGYAFIFFSCSLKQTSRELRLILNKFLRKIEHVFKLSGVWSKSFCLFYQANCSCLWTEIKSKIKEFGKQSIFLHSFARTHIPP